MQFKSLLAIDPSLTQTGWAYFSLREMQPRAVGVIRAPGPELPYQKRLSDLQDKVGKLFASLEIGERDILVCEGPAPLVLNPQSALKVEHVRSIFESLAREYGAEVPGRLNPRTIQRELLGMKGKQLPRKEVKIWARNTAERLYAQRLPELVVNGFSSPPKETPQDVIDALLVGSLALSRVKLAGHMKSELCSVFAEKRARR